MPENPRIQLPFGQGLDRETGVMTVRPGTFEDIRNVLLHQGKAIVRPGFDPTVTLYDDEDNEVDHIVQGYSLRSGRIGVVVSFVEGASPDYLGKVWVHRIDTLGATAELVGEWENDQVWGADIPRISMCESYGTVFMAHDTSSITKRAPTIYYDPLSGGAPLKDLEGMFEGAGPTLSIGTTDTAVGSTAFTFFLENIRYEKDAVAAGTAIGAQTVAADKWALYRPSVSTAEVVTVTPAAGNVAGYANEDAAIAALPDVPANEADMGYFTVKTKAGLVWIAGTDALAGGDSGNEASETNYYTGEEEYFTHVLRYRGVVRHLDYLFGWGYGDENEDRPELVRSSDAGNPTVFKPVNFYIAGDRRDPVLTCRPAGSVLVVFKEVESHALFGSGRDDWGITILDPLYGCTGSQLAANRGGTVVAWSAEGPRIWDGSGPSTEIAIPLELAGSEPNDLVTEGNVDTAFAAYIPELRVMAFFFGQRVYALTTRVEGDWKWSYWELGFTPLCAFTLYPGSQDTVAPTGKPWWTSEAASGTYVDVTVQNIDQDGDETLELWLSEDDGEWFLANSALVEVGVVQVIRGGAIEGDDVLTTGTDYRGAVRYRRGVLYTQGYTDEDPMNWGSNSLGAFNTSIAPPIWVSGVWERTAVAAEKIVLTVTPAVGEEAHDINVYRDGGLLDTIAGPHSGDATYDDIACAGETDEVYTFITNTGVVESELSDEETVWAGPTLLPAMDWVISGGDEGYDAWIVPGDVGNPTEVADNYDDAGGTGAFAVRFTIDAAGITGDSGALIGLPGAPPPVTIEIKARHKETAFTTDDFSKYSEVMELDMLDHP
jgi:hypothetical protein